MLFLLPLLPLQPLLWLPEKLPADLSLQQGTAATEVGKCSEQPGGLEPLRGLKSKAQGCGPQHCPPGGVPMSSRAVSQTREQGWIPWVQVASGAPSPDVELDGQCLGKVGSVVSALCSSPEHTG